MNPKKVVIKLLKKNEKGSFSNILIDNFFKDNEINNKEKGFITELFYGTIRNKILVDWIVEKFVKKVKKKEIKYILEISIYQILFMETEDRSVVWESVEIVKNDYSKKLSGFINGVLKNFLREKDEIINQLKEDKKFDILYSYPKWVVEYFSKFYNSDELEEFLIRYKQRPLISCRANRNNYSQKEIISYFDENSIEFKRYDEVLYFKSINLINSSLLKEGKVLIQDYSSFFAANTLNLEKNDKILDMCAAPGTKTTILIENADSSMEIIANDINEKKKRLIEENLKKYDFQNISISTCDGRKIEGQNYYDKILLDAPCSGFGVISKKPEILYNKNYKDILRLAEIQKELLDSAYRLLKKGGELVYSTCTIFSEENMDNSKWFLEKYSENIEVKEIKPAENIAYKRDKFGGIIIDYKEKYADSFYIIKFRKK